jgi:VCBS repeat-containing protein
MFDSSLTGNFSQAWEVCALTPESIENIFVSLDTSGVVNGTCSVAGGTNACFGEWTALATAAYDNLIGKSWTIEYNYCPPPAEALITLTASPTAVVNTGTTNIIFSFTRTGSTANPLTVDFNVGGTATLGTDYTQSGAASFSPTSGSILIPAGQTTAQITIDPDPGASIVSSETVEITLVSGSGYTPVTTNPVVGTIYEDILPVAIQQTIYIHSILETIDGNLLTGEVNTPGPDPTLPAVSRSPVVGAGGPSNQIFELISDSVGSYGIFTLSSNGNFVYTVDLTNSIVRNLSPYTPPNYTRVDDSFQFRVTDLAGNTSEGVVNIAVLASYKRFAAAFSYDPFPPTDPNQGRKRWFLNGDYTPLSAPDDGSGQFYGLNYPWSGPLTNPPVYITGYTDGSGYWILGGPPPSGWFD